MIRDWPEFYDPDLYEEKVGPGARVGDTYAALLAGPPLRVVEYGCGPGEILLRLAQDGHTVTGLDRVPAMVERARLRAEQAAADVAARITVEYAEAREPNKGAPADRVLLTNELVLHALSPAVLTAMFDNAYAALSPGGVVILDLPLVDMEALARAAGPLKDQEFCRGYFDRREGSTLRVTERCVFDPASWLKEMTFSYQTINGRGEASSVHYRRLVQRVWTLQEILFALRIAGFEAAQGEIRAELPDRHVVTASKPGGA